MKKVQLQYPVFPAQTIPKGALSPEIGCQACWYFYVLAEQARRKAGNSIDSQMIVVPTGQDNSLPWMNKEYEGIAKAVTILYSLESPDDFQRYWPLVTMQAMVAGMPTPHWEYTGRRRLHKIEV